MNTKNMYKKNRNVIWLLIHTMTITENNYQIRAQFIHALDGDTDLRSIDRIRLLARRIRVSMNPSLITRRDHFKNGYNTNLKSIVKKKHHLKSDTSSTKSNSYLTPINQGSPTLPVMKQQQQPIVQIVAPLQHTQNIQEPKQDIQVVDPKVNIKATSTNQDVIKWLMENRLDNFIETFQNFNGRDLLRLTRNDVLQICGEADGIRFFNILHDKAITPRSKIYICKANSNVFHAIFLSSNCKDDLKQELCDIVGLLTNQVNDMYMEGPNNIHVIISNSVIYHIKEESAFSINILKEKDYYALLLKPIK